MEKVFQKKKLTNAQISEITGKVTSLLDVTMPSHLPTAFTLTLKPNLHVFKDSVNRQYVVRKLLPYCRKNHIRFFLVPELTEIRKALHFHGSIKFHAGPDSMFRFKKWANKNIGFCKLKYIDDFNYWRAYCYKYFLTKDKPPASILSYSELDDSHIFKLKLLGSKT